MKLILLLTFIVCVAATAGLDSNKYYFPPYQRDSVSTPAAPKFETQTIFQTASQIAALKSFVDLVNSTGYEDILALLNSADGPSITLFAPNNDAFAFVEVDPEDSGVVTEILKYHMLNGSYRSTDFKHVCFPPTLLADNDFVHLNGSAQVLPVNRVLNQVVISFGIPGEASLTAHVLSYDIPCSNGFINIIDRIILPPNMTATTLYRAGLTSFLSALHHFDLLTTVDHNDSMTIFAPTNEAFFKIDFTKFTISQIYQVLQYHIIPNQVVYSTDFEKGLTLETLSGETLKLSSSFFGGYSVNRAAVLWPNSLSNNGVVHIISEVLLPLSMQQPQQPPQQEQQQPQQPPQQNEQVVKQEEVEFDLPENILDSTDF